MHTRSKKKWWTVNYLELSGANNEEDLENELDLEVEAYRAYNENNKRDRMCERVKQH